MIELQFNIYQFKVTYYGQRGQETWYPPITAQTWAEAQTRLYGDTKIESATLQIIILPDETEKVGRSIREPRQYDLR